MNALFLDRLYVIVDHPDWLLRLLPEGVKLVQLRMKDCAEDVLRASSQEALAICQKFGAQLVLNDHWKIAIDLGINCVHLGQEDLDHADVKALRRANIKLGMSTHTEEECERALSCAPDYIALGPIFKTILKPMRYPPQGLEKIKIWKKKIGDLPLVAIGGLTPERGKDALEQGAQSVAVVTDILRHPFPEKRVGAWQAALL